MRRLAVSFTNFGPYHLARLRALAGRLERQGDRLIAYETAGAERKYPWRTTRGAEPFDWVTLFPDTDLESIPRSACTSAMRAALDRDRPDAVAGAGYVRPEVLAAADWARRRRRVAILMSESQAIDRPRAWWKESLKARRVRRFDAALVGGPSHRHYLTALGLPRDRIALGYNAVDNDHFAALAVAARQSPAGRDGLPTAPYFLAVCRFDTEKNLARLVRAFALYRASVPEHWAWELALVGDGPGAPEIVETVRQTGLGAAIHRPGFLQADELPRWYAFASAFVLPSLSEPWGLVVNEAAAAGLPLLVSDRAGCAATLVPDPPGTTGWRFDPTDEAAMAAALGRMAALDEPRRAALGQQAAANVAAWGPERFADGMLDAWQRAGSAEKTNRLALTAGA